MKFPLQNLYGLLATRIREGAMKLPVAVSGGVGRMLCVLGRHEMTLVVLSMSGTVHHVPVSGWRGVLPGAPDLPFVPLGRLCRRCGRYEVKLTQVLEATGRVYLHTRNILLRDSEEPGAGKTGARVH